MKKTALITGGTGGLGLALSKLLADNGWHVFAADCDENGLNALQNTDNITPLFLDVTQTESVETAFKAVSAETDHLDAVVNFAGILRVGSMLEMDEAVLQNLLNINLMGTWRVNKTFFPLLRKGRIVNISSETGWHSAAPFNGAYAISKYGIEAYSDALRRELLIYDVPVIVVQPGPFKTNLVSNIVNGFNQAAETSELYKEQLGHFSDLVHDANLKAAEPELLAKVILKALTAKKPKIRYSVKAAKDRSFLEMFPTRLNDWIFKKILGKYATKG